MAHQPQQHRRRNDGPPPDSDFEKWLKESINLRKPSPELFDTHAQKIALTLRPDPSNKQSSNKSAQIRRFYDELLRFRSSAKTDEQVQKALPFIRMINAKAAYASARESEGAPLVDSKFTQFLRVMLNQIEDRNTLNNACTLFEAVIGFSPRN